MCYFGSVLVKSEAVGRTLAHHLGNPKLGRIDMVVGIGLSGTLPLPLVAQYSGLRVCPIRKPNEDRHSYHTIEDVNFHNETPEDCRYAIVDDFTASGQTVDGIIQLMRERWPGSVCVGAFLYEKGDSDLELGVESFRLWREVDEVDKLLKEEKTWN